MAAASSLGEGAKMQGPGRSELCRTNDGTEDGPQSTPASPESGSAARATAESSRATSRRQGRSRACGEGGGRGRGRGLCAAARAEFRERGSLAAVETEAVTAPGTGVAA